MSKTVWSIPGGDRAPRMPGVRWTGDGIQAPAPRRRGSALVPTLIVVSALATLGLAMLSSSLDGARTVNFEDDEYSLTSAVESVAALAAENLWTGFLALDSGTPGSIAQFRTFLDGQGVLNDPNSLSGTGTPPNAQQGTEITSILNLPAGGLGGALFDSVQVDAVRIYRLDDLGSFSWERMDGTRTVQEIAEELRAEFGDEVDQAEERLARLVRWLSAARASSTRC